MLFLGMSKRKNQQWYEKILKIMKFQSGQELLTGGQE